MSPYSQHAQGSKANLPVRQNKHEVDNPKTRNIYILMRENSVTLSQTPLGLNHENHARLTGRRTTHLIRIRIFYLDR